MSIDDQLRSLTDNEKTVLFYKAQGLKYEQIAVRLGYSLDWVQLQMSSVYTKLGFTKDMHWTKRRDILEKNIYPKIPKNLKDWLAKDEITELPSSPKEEPPPPTPAKPEPEPDPEMMALVLADERQIEIVQPKPIVIASAPPKTHWFVRFLRYAIFALVGLCLLSVVAYFAYTFGRGSGVPLTVIITATLPAATDTPIPTLTLEPTETVIPSPAKPTGTPYSTATLGPTRTPKLYYDEGQNVQLEEGVYMHLSEDFHRRGGPCGAPDVGFGVSIILEDTTLDTQDLIRIDSTGFHAVDNLGNEYKLVAIGMGGSAFCNDLIGPPLEWSLDYGYRRGYISMQFQGQVPLEAEYFLITADWINGKGPFVFRKDL